ncbi:MAG: alpha/beta hydrolase [Steroidobacteraceae bacterium]
MFTPATIAATREMLAPLALHPQAIGADVVRDLQYGADARQRLDIFHAPGNLSPRPVVVFVHGGGFALGDKGDADAPFYNNFGAWAVRAGFVGVTMTYRHAPAHVWPSGAVDVAAAVDWLARNVAPYHGDHTAIVLVGQSAGAAHVAGYLAGHGGALAHPLAAVLMSGIYEPDRFARNPMHEVYFGVDRALYPRRSTVLPLAATDVPCLFTISEFDPAQFQQQLAAVFAARTALCGKCPEVLYLPGQNHVSPAMQLGSAVDPAGEHLADYVRRSYAAHGRRHQEI